MRTIFRNLAAGAVSTVLLLASAFAAELRVQPLVTERGFTGLAAQLTLTGCASGRTRVYLPDAWGGEPELYRAIRDLTIVGEGRIEAAENVAQRVVYHKPGEKFTLRYHLVEDKASTPSKPKEGGNDYRARFSQTHFHVIGNTLVPSAECTSMSAAAKFEIAGMPSGTKFASDLEHHSMGRNLTFADLIESVLVGGDFRVIDAGGGARLAIRGTWPTPDEVWREKFVAIARAQRAYWRTKDEPFLVTIQQTPSLGPGSVSVGGTGRADAFAFFANPESPIETIVKVMSHEMMHTWVPRRIGGALRSAEPLAYWLSEGFTDWASWRVLMRSGLWAPEDFAAAFNEAVKQYDASPARVATNQTVLERFWTDEHIQRLPYQRGMLLATYWDATVQRATKGAKRLDDVLFEMQRLSDLSDPASDRAAPTLFREAMRSIANIDVSADIERFVNDGDAVVIDENHFQPCGKFSTRRRKSFHRGFDVQSTLKNNNTIAGVVKDGPAYKAGMRDGMTLVGRRGGLIGDSRQEIVYEVVDQGKSLTLRYLPEGEGTESFRELAIERNLAADVRDRCIKRLSGHH